MSHLRPVLAKRLDRLARRAHAFHRWSHHPLCAAYAGEVIRIGPRARVCRGCALVAAGALAGLIAGLLGAWSVAGALGLGAVAWGGFRRSKLATRFAPAFAAAALCVGGVGHGGPLGLGGAALVGAAAAAAVVAYRRRGPDRRACAACAERAMLPTCSGFEAMRRREAAFGRLAAALVARDRAARQRV